MLQRQLPLGLSLGFLLALSAGSTAARETPSEAAVQSCIQCEGQYEAEFTEFASTGEDNKAKRAGRVPPEVTVSTLVISISDDQDITVQRIRVTTSAEGRTWFGVVRETGESALLMWWKDGSMTGMLGYKGRRYTIMNVSGEVRAIVEGDARETLHDHPFLSLKRSADSRLGDNSIATSPQSPPPPTIPEVKPFSDAERLALEAKKITIDLMILYTKKAAGRYIIDLPDLIALATEQVNESFRNSGLENISLRLVHTQLVDYEEKDAGHFEHLYRMVDGAGPFKEVHKLRDEKRADIVGMILEDPSECGLSTRVGADAEQAYFVVHHSCAAITISIAHEIGHIIGARHDRQTDATNSPFPYGHGYVNGTKWRDIMSYQRSCNGCPRIPYWSNPRVQYKGEPTGTDANDNARVLLEQSERVSKFR